MQDAREIRKSPNVSRIFRWPLIQKQTGNTVRYNTHSRGEFVNPPVTNQYPTLLEENIPGNVDE
jgi:hypothetical protein